jgi:hypothetical protein
MILMNIPGLCGWVQTPDSSLNWSLTDHWKEFYNPVIKKVVDVNNSVLSSYTGKYLLNGEVITFSKIDNDLMANYRNMLWKVRFTSDTDFFFPEYKADFRFQKDNEGNVKGFTVSGFVMAKKVQ